MAIPKAPPIPKILRIKQKDWLKGYQSTLDDDRKDMAGLKTAINAIVEQNGTARPRPSLVPYGVQPTGTVLGQVYAFIKMNGTTPENWEISVQNVSGTAKVYVRKKDSSSAWTVCNGKSYDTSARCHFEQVNSRIIITNGVDYHSYLDIASLTVIPSVALTTPTGVGIANGGSTNLTTTGTFPWRLRVSAVNANGETAASSAATQSINKIRDQWAGGATEFLTYSWNRVTNATGYVLYVGDSAGNEVYLDTVADLGSGATQSYKDDGSAATNFNRLAPNGDSTAGIKGTRVTNVLGTIYMVGDTDNPYRLWFGGTTSDTSMDFSPFDGGGWVEIDKGGRYFPAVVKGFRTGKGDAAVSIFMKGTSGAGKLIHALPDSTTLGNTLITFLNLQEANGQDGTSAPDAVVYAHDAYWFLSRNGPKTTGTRAQIQNILSTNDFGEQINGDSGIGYKQLNVQSLDYACGVEFEGRLYFGVPVGSTTNNQVWMSDLNRNGLWMLPWDIAADWLWLADDTSGSTHLMVLSNNTVYELSYNQLTKDDSTAFSCKIGSGLIKFSDDGQDWGSVIDITFVFLRPQGNINVSITGATEDQPIAPIGVGSFAPVTSTAGWNEAPWNQRYWNQVVTVPTSFGQQRETVTIDLDEELNWLTWEVSSAEAGVDFQLSEVIIRYVDIGVIDT